MKKTQIILLQLITPLLIAALMISCGSKGPYNPYLTAKTKPSQANVKEDKKLKRKAGKAYRKQLRSSRKKVFGKKVAPK